jgi:hypothetical protein
MELLREPFEPRATPEYVFARYTDNIEEWTGYLEGW